MRNLIKLLSLVLCLSLLTGVVFAYQETDLESKWGGIFWAYDAETQTLSLKAAVDNESDMPWDTLRTSVKSIQIADDVVALPEEAFFKFGMIETVTLPAGLQSVGYNAFENCDDLKSAQILCSTDTLLATFLNCRNLETVTIKGNIQNYTATFGGCSNLKEIRIPDGAERLEGTFSNCHRLTSVDLPDSITEIGDSAFIANWYLKELELPASLRRIGVSAFAACCNLEELVIPAGVMSIGSYAFEKNSMRSLPGYEGITFEGVKTLRFTGNPPAFAYDAFGATINSACVAEMTCYYPGNNPNWTEDVLQNYGGIINWVPYEAEDPNPVLSGQCGEDAYWTYDNGRLTISGTGPMEEYGYDRRPFWSAYKEQMTAVVVEEGITHISDFAFTEHTALRSVMLPESLKSIGAEAFSYCGALSNIELPEGLTEIGAAAFAASGLTELEVPASVENYTSGIVMVCENMTNLVFRSDSWLPGSTFSIADLYNVRTVTFTGDAPVFDSTGLSGIQAEIYYPINNSTWVTVVQSNYGGNIKWIGYLPEGEEDNTHPVFEDVHNNKFYYDSVTWAYENAITNGVTPTKFGPMDPCTRAQVVTFLWRAAGSPEPTITEHPFEDVKPGAFYYNAMLWAVENGITTGVDETHFMPGGACNRGQVVTFLYRVKDKPAVDLEGNPFADVAEGKYYFDAVAWAVEAGITNGVSVNSFAPDQVCNRGQIVTFLMRAYQ